MVNASAHCQVKGLQIPNLIKEYNLGKIILKNLLIEERVINDELLQKRSFLTFLNKKYLTDLNVIGLVEIMSQLELFYLFT